MKNADCTVVPAPGVESSSLSALRQALAWANEQGMAIVGLLDESQLAELVRVFSHERPWSFDLYEPLRALSHALPRLDAPDLPVQLHFADCLTALNEVLLRDAAAGVGEGAYGEGLRRYAWERDHVVSPSAFATLGYSASSADLTKLRARNRGGWEEHAARNRAFLLQPDAHDTAVILGAGKLYDIPLRLLAERYERLVLVDVDGAALAESADSVLRRSDHRAHIELVTADVTGVGAGFVRAVEEIFARTGSAEATYQALLALLYSFRSYGEPSLLPPDKTPAPPSACLSVMLLSQLAEPLTRFVERRFVECFAGDARLRAHEFRVALAQFTHRIQHQHVQALLCKSESVSLTSDVSDQQTRLAPKERSLLQGPPLPVIGAPHLVDLFPAAGANEIVTAEWTWPHVQPTPKRPTGRLFHVQAAHVPARSSKAGSEANSEGRRW
jgi:hypothetical protein